MSDPKDNSYGVRPKYQLGDEVKVWPVYKRPIGTIQGIEDPDTFPIKYLVQYTYEDGRVFNETFESSDLTLHRTHSSKYSAVCECGSNSGRHDGWCPKFKYGG